MQLKGVQPNQRGFTIVELLIVIVIIAVLATIVIFAYNGVQQRAKNSHRISAAKDLQKLIAAYTSTNGAYPAGSINTHNCLGDVYPTDLDGNPDVDCHASTNVKHPSSSINTAYRTVASLPKFPEDKFITGSSYGTVVGISLRSHDTLDPSGVAKPTYLILHIPLHSTRRAVLHVSG